MDTVATDSGEYEVTLVDEVFAPMEPLSNRLVATADEWFDLSVRKANMIQKHTKHPLFDRSDFARN